MGTTFPPPSRQALPSGESTAARFNVSVISARPTDAVPSCALGSVELVVIRVTAYGVTDGYGVGDSDGYGVGDSDGYGVGDTEGYGVGDTDGYGVGETEGYGVGDVVGSGVGSGYGVGETVGSGVGEGFGSVMVNELGVHTGHWVGVGLASISAVPVRVVSIVQPTTPAVIASAEHAMRLFSFMQSSLRRCSSK